MRNFVQKGAILTLLVATATAAGEAVLVGKIFGVAVSDVPAGSEGEFETEGVFTLPVLGTDAAAQGGIAYWDSVNKRLTTTANGNTRVGVFTGAKAAGVAVGSIKIDSVIT